MPGIQVLPSTGERAVVSAGDIVVDPVSRQVMRGGKMIRLTPQEFLLLEYLVRNKNKVLSKSDIAFGIWGDDSSAKSRRVAVFVTSLRKKLTEANCRNYIYTIMKKGYLLADRSL